MDRCYGHRLTCLAMSLLLESSMTLHGTLMAAHHPATPLPKTHPQPAPNTTTHSQAASNLLIFRVRHPRSSRPSSTQASTHLTHTPHMTT
ncbi:hypothetical protein E2C01_018288 [Portunus trituberculatus]|uniref:Secreted protein n=1 Tax=Portunus trituberculatus TaxID=210409 RepID=A0A5B7DV42_PORTR|nr:hypothetical protein [Portunus trituberculatus]